MIKQDKNRKVLLGGFIRYSSSDFLIVLYINFSQFRFVSPSACSPAGSTQVTWASFESGLYGMGAIKCSWLWEDSPPKHTLRRHSVSVRHHVIMVLVLAAAEAPIEPRNAFMDASNNVNASYKY